VAAGECDCERVLDGVRENLKADLEASHGRLTSQPLPVVHADPVLIAQLFQNLVENALKYRGELPPHVHVSVVRRPDCWLFSVRDNGIGIERDHMGQLFQPFRQALGTGQRPRGGVGLGLATCKRIVERHGGSITVQSVPGRGATFEFSIPHRSPAAADPARG
jgi:signal transduction histidine kinase